MQVRERVIYLQGVWERLTKAGLWVSKGGKPSPVQIGLGSSQIHERLLGLELDSLAKCPLS